MVGNRNINLAGTIVMSVFIAACGGSKSGIQFIVFRAIQGIGASMTMPTAGTVMCTVANLIITDSFPDSTQALAGAVFNTVSQFGTAVGIAVMAVISTSVTNESSTADKTSPDALMVGYRAAFWACFALMVLATLTGAIGLRNVWRVGVKKAE
ncbi:MAG: hypothetical protein Q9163_004852 [Psora crenata]